MPTLSILIPALNEEKTISHVIERVLAVDLGQWIKEIIVVNDGSTDGTEAAVQSFGDQVRYFKHPKNLGKGQAIKTALVAARGEYVIMQDADLEYDPADIAAMTKLVDKGQAEVVFGSRNLHPGRQGYPSFVLGVKILTGLTNLLFGSKLTDVYTCYKLIPLEVIKRLNLQSAGFEFEAEVTAKLLKRKCRILEVPITYSPRTFAAGKKIGWLDGLKGLWTIIRYAL